MPGEQALAVKLHNSRRPPRGGVTMKAASAEPSGNRGTEGNNSTPGNRRGAAAESYALQLADGREYHLAGGWP